MIGSGVRVDGERLMARLEELSRIGRAPGGGVTRLALSKEDWEAHGLFRRWMEDAGLTVSMDRAGNLFGRLDGLNPTLLPVLLGSHLDTVPEGGAFDGALGCVAALEAVSAILEAGIQPQNPLEVAVWTDEEGARFGTGFLGSRSFAGRHAPESLTLTDAAGISLADALRRRGLDPARIGTDPVPPVGAYLELHIEQGPTLEELGIPVGIVTGIVGIGHFHVEVEGRAGHAGTTPMTKRADALTAASEMVLAAEGAAREAGPGAVATVGQLTVGPGASNVIPGRCSFSLDIRDFDATVRDRAYDLVRDAIDTIARRRGVTVTVQETLRVPPVPMSPAIQEVLAHACEREGVPVYRLPSGAGHDAMILAELAPAGMLFTRCVGGISHNPAEAVIPEDAVIGTQVLLDAALELAG